MNRVAISFFKIRRATVLRAVRSPVRPNPIGTSIVRLVGLEGATLIVQGLDCLDGTPLLDLKPERTLFKPIAPAQLGDLQTA